MALWFVLLLYNSYYIAMTITLLQLYLTREYSEAARGVMRS